MKFARHSRLFQLALLLVSLCLCGNARVLAEAFDNQLPAEVSGMGVTEHLSEVIPLETEFRDENGRPVRLQDFFRPNRPVILSLNYSNCPMLCSLQLTGLVEALKDVELTCGQDFEFVSISVDPHELPQRAAQTRQRYFQQYGRQGTGPGWHFLVGNEQAISTVAKAVGVSYRYLPDKREYVHPAVCMAVTPDGRLSRYLYGVSFIPQTLRLALVEASAGQIGTTVDQILLFCFHYDNQSGKYSLAARRLMTIAGAVTAVLVAAYMAVQLRRERRSSLRIGRGDAAVMQTVLLKVDVEKPSDSSATSTMKIQP